MARQRTQAGAAVSMWGPLSKWAERVLEKCTTDHSYRKRGAGIDIDGAARWAGSADGPGKSREELKAVDRLQPMR